MLNKNHLLTGFESQLEKISLLIFDLDDTLYPEMEYVKSGFKEVSKKLSEITHIKEKKIYEMLIEEFEADRNYVFDRVLIKLNLYKPNIINEMINIYRYHKPKIRPYEDVVEILNKLKNNYCLGIISDGESLRQLNKLDALGIKNYFQNVICTGDKGKLYIKPSEKPFIDMINYFNKDAKEAAYIGDNVEKDFYAANKLGMISIKIKRPGLYKDARHLYKEYLPKIELNSLYELINLLKA